MGGAKTDLDELGVVVPGRGLLLAAGHEDHGAVLVDGPAAELLGEVVGFADLVFVGGWVGG